MPASRPGCHPGAYVRCFVTCSVGAYVSHCCVFLFLCSSRSLRFAFLVARHLGAYVSHGCFCFLSSSSRVRFALLLFAISDRTFRIAFCFCFVLILERTFRIAVFLWFVFILERTFRLLPAKKRHRRRCPGLQQTGEGNWRRRAPLTAPGGKSKTPRGLHQSARHALLG